MDQFLKRNPHKPLKIGIDIDNTITESFIYYVERYNLVFGKNLKHEEIEKHLFVGYNDGLTQEESNIFMDKALHDEEFQMKFQPIEKAQEVIYEWSKNGYSIHYITARPVTTKNITEKWLKNNKLWMKNCTLDLIPSNARTDNEQVEYKKSVATGKNLDLIIEDSFEIANGIGIPAVLINRAWNQGKIKPNVKRADNWNEINNLVSLF